MSSDNTQSGGAVGLPAGTKIGKYEIRERMGVGGQAIIYRAYDGVLDRFVAIKQISSHLAEDTRFLERFRREAQILARLGSDEPCIIDVYELLEDQRGLFIVMEFVPGKTLEALMREHQGPAEPKATLRILWQLSSALHTVHAAGIIHRDIKPSNIIVGETLRVKIADFGVAASIQGQTSMLMGTTKYMAPELLLGVEADGRADMYSLGFIAYEMLVGRRKFNEIFADVVRDSSGEPLRWMKWHGNSLVTAPPLHEVVPSVPRALSEIIARMIAKDPSDRYSDMEELGKAIRTNFSPRRATYAAIATESAMALQLDQPHDYRRVLADEIIMEAEESAQGPALSMENLPTAPLPESGLSRRSKLILLGIVVFCVIVAGATLAVRGTMRATEVRQEALAVLDAGMKSYWEGQYDKSLRAYEDLLDRFGQSPQAAQAQVYIPLARGQLAVREHNWTGASEALAAASNAVKAVQANRSDLTEWSRQARQSVEEFEKLLINSRTFIEAMQAAESYLAVRNFAEARQKIDKELSSVALTTAQALQRDAFLHRLDLEQFKHEFAGRLDAAQQAARGEKLEEAQTDLVRVGEMLDSAPTGLLSAGESEKLKGDLAGANKSLLQERDYRVALAAADKARLEADKVAELTALQSAAAIHPTPELSGQVRDLQVQLSLQRGKEFKAAGRLEEAKEVLREAVKMGKTSAASAELADVDQLIQQRDLIEAGDTALGGGKLDEALAKYLEADKLRSDAELNDKIADARYRIHMTKADSLRDAKNYSEAAAAYERARRAKPAAAADVDARLAAMKKKEQYDRLLARIRDLRKQEKYSETLRYLKDAKALADTPEVNELMTRTRYDQAVALGREAMAREDYKNAQAYLTMARKYKDTDEVNQLLNDVEARLKTSKDQPRP